MTTYLPAPVVDLSFAHRWQAEILTARPLILPARHFVYPRQAEEVERGALELLIRPAAGQAGECNRESPLSAQFSPSGMGFLATCAVGFLDPALPTGLWSTPNPEEICAVSGGYAYLIDTTVPERFTMLACRPVLEVRPLPTQGLLLFVNHRSILAWGREGQAWQSEKLSSEGVEIASIDGDVLRGLGWDLFTTKEVPFSLDLRTGLRIS
ncbi:MAG: hypothetical protein ABR898_04675 [Terracidiphilus sp.]